MKQVHIYKIQNLKHRSLRLILDLLEIRCYFGFLWAKTKGMSVLVSQTTGEGGTKEPLVSARLTNYGRRRH